jgi:uncharacterized protein
MSNRRLLQAPAAALTGYRLQNEHLLLFKAKDGRPVFACLYADTARGRNVISGHAPRRYHKTDLSDRTSLRTE